MQTPVRITFKNLAHKDEFEAMVRERVERLEKTYPRLTGCHVTIEVPHRHQSQGAAFQIHVVLSVPGAELMAGRPPRADDGHEDFRVALRDAFLAARRELVDHARRQRETIPPDDEHAQG